MKNATPRRLKVAIGGIWHETHAFASATTELTDFECFSGQQLIDAFKGTRSPLGGFIDWNLGQENVEIIPAFFASAIPSGLVSRKAYDTLTARLTQAIKTITPDLILLDLHGAMVVEGCLDVESDLLVRLRGRVGSNPIGAVLDYHANISASFVELVDIVAGYNSYPHTDQYERGLEVAERTLQTALGRIRPTRAIIQPPLLIPPQSQFTDREPMARLMRRAEKVRRLPSVLNVTVAAGFPYSDVPQSGFSVTVTTDRDRVLASTLAAEIAQEAWNQRDEFSVTAVSPVEAITRAVQSPTFPTILVDSADNIGGGSPGDGTTLLRELLKAKAAGAVISIADPIALAEITQAGVGADIRVSVGGKTDAFHGAPVEVRAHVVRISNADFNYKGTYMTSRRVHAGMAAVLDADGVTVIVRERKVMPFDSEELRVLGIEPTHCLIIVVKSAIAWRAAYGDIAKTVIEVDTLGICSPRLLTLPFQNVRRPILPLDRKVKWSARESSGIRATVGARS